MASSWTAWVKWNGTLEQTLLDGQHQLAGETTVAAARARAEKAGTSSLLDVVNLTDKPFLGQCWVLSPDELHRYFGSKTPPKKAIEAGIESFMKKLEKDQAVAITSFTKHLASAVLFACKH
ncbi:MAG: hypothetical protein QM723_11540 [Myxococcaceae bacterium]